MLKRLVIGTLRRFANAGARADADAPDIGALLRQAADRLGQGDDSAAERLCHAALAGEPGHPDGANLLGLVALRRRDFVLAEELFSEAISAMPEVADYHNNRGIALMELWRAREALAEFRRAIALDPAHALANGNLLYLLNAIPDVTDEARFEAHCRWAERFADRGASLRFGGDRNPERVLRVGYVSADFRNHAVGYFVAPLLARHDARAVSVYCYSNRAKRDEMTERMRAHATWRELHGRSDAEAEQMIRGDAIDVLVDLSGHTQGNRLPVFARRPAPVQVTFLGYPATTGMAAIDYRLTDACADPPGESERYYREKLVRLPRSLWCYRPGDDMPEVAPLPAGRTGRVTFGSMNSVLKLNARVIGVGARILAAVAGSRLLIATVASGEARERIAAEFAAHGIDKARLSFVDRIETHAYRRLFGDIDIALDPFPCNGGTTTCESLWMGVPVVTLAGDGFRSRAGLSLLTHAGLTELVAADENEYVARAAALAGDLSALAALRAGLRDMLRESPLMDIEPYVRDLEAAYRRMWREACRA